MVSALPVGTRVLAPVVLLLGAIVGLAMAVAGAGEAFGTHGWIVLLFCTALAVQVLIRLDAPELPRERLRLYYDDPIKVGIILAMVWVVIGMGFGLWIAYLLAWPDLTFDAPWASYGRMRPAHTSGVIFGFGGTALIATSFRSLGSCGGGICHSRRYRARGCYANCWPAPRGLPGVSASRSRAARPGIPPPP